MVPCLFQHPAAALRLWPGSPAPTVCCHLAGPALPPFKGPREYIGHTEPSAPGLPSHPKIRNLTTSAKSHLPRKGTVTGSGLRMRTSLGTVTLPVHLRAGRSPQGSPLPPPWPGTHLPRREAPRGPAVQKGIPPSPTPGPGGCPVTASCPESLPLSSTFILTEVWRGDRGLFCRRASWNPPSHHIRRRNVVRAARFQRSAGAH